MLTSYKYEAKTEEEALEKCLEELETKEEELYIKKQETEKTLFKSKKVEIEVIKKEDVVNYIKEYIKTLCNLMNIETNVELRESEAIYNVQIISENNAILIGRDGRSIASIQQLLRQALNTNTGFSIKVNVDVSNYKGKKVDRIEREVKRIIREVLKSKIDVSLDPMNAYERRAIHTLVSEFENLETESVGEGTERHIVIKYVGK